jgi:hypothetical protein
LSKAKDGSVCEKKLILNARRHIGDGIVSPSKVKNNDSRLLAKTSRIA